MPVRTRRIGPAPRQSGILRQAVEPSEFRDDQELYTFPWAEGDQYEVTVDTQFDENGARYIFTGWSDGVTTPTRTITVGADAAAYVALYRTQFQLVIHNPNSTMGTVQLTPAPADSSQLYDAGTQVALKAIPNAGFRFVSWSGATVDAPAITTITMDGPKEVTVNWAGGVIGDLRTKPTSLFFYATQGGSNPPPQKIRIWNAGGNTGAQWVTQVWSGNQIIAVPSWLSFSPTSGTDTGEVTVSVDASRASLGRASADPVFLRLAVPGAPPGAGLYGADIFVQLTTARSPTADQLLWFAGGETFTRPQWSPDGREVSAVDLTKRSYVYDSRAGQLLRVIPGELRSPDSPKFLGVDPNDSNCLKVWEAGTGTVLARFGQAPDIRLLEYRGSLAVATKISPNLAMIINADNGSTFRTFADVTFATLSPIDARIFLRVPAGVGPSRIVDVNAGEEVSFTIGGGVAGSEQAAWSPDGGKLALTESSTTGLRFVIVDAKTGSVLQRLSPSIDDPGYGSRLQWHPNGKYLAGIINAQVNGVRRGIGIWDVTNGQLVATLGPPSPPVSGIQWSPDGSKLAATFAGAVDEQGLGVFRFVASPASSAPQPPLLLSPDNNFVSKRQPTFRVRAQAPDGAILKYRIEVSRNAQFTEVFAAYDQNVSTELWSKPLYAPGEEAVLTIPNPSTSTGDQPPPPPDTEIVRFLPLRTTLPVGAFWWRAYVYNASSNQWSASAGRQSRRLKSSTLDFTPVFPLVDGDPSETRALTVSANSKPDAPTLLSPSLEGTVGSTPQLVMQTSDPDRDRVKFKVELSRDNFQTVFRAWAQPNANAVFAAGPGVGSVSGTVVVNSQPIAGARPCPDDR